MKDINMWLYHNEERRVNPLKRFKFDLLVEKAKLETEINLHGSKYPNFAIVQNSRIVAIDNAVMLLNEALELVFRDF